MTEKKYRFNNEVYTFAAVNIHTSSKCTDIVEKECTK